MKVLVAVDSSSSYESVVNEVAAEVWPRGTCLCVLSVVEPSYLWNVAGTGDTPQESAENLVQLAAKRLTNGSVQAYGVVKQGDPKTVIVDEAQAIAADLVVVGSRGHSGVTRFLMGSVAQAVVRYAPCSVRVVRPHSKEEPAVYSATRILLGTDGSEFSEIAARIIAQRPWLPGSEVNIVSVVELSVSPVHAPFFDSDAVEASRAEAMAHAQQAIMKAEAVITEAGLKTTETLLLPTASVKDLILQEAVRWDAGLIVLGSHGRRGLKRFLIGSVSEAVAVHSTCTVEVVRGAGASGSRG
jgi:nucleotide-binding universal stress UspA family protein